MNRDDLKTTFQAITAVDALVGSAVPENMRRFIYKIKAQNTSAGAAELTIGKRENGAGATTVVDQINFAVPSENWLDPEELKEDSMPLYIIEGKGSTGDSYLYAAMDAGNTCNLIIWYIDSPA
jgi:hypothetical protein